MYKFLALTLLLSLAGGVFSSSKPVSIRDKKVGQLITSSLLSWEHFNVKNDVKQQLEYAITAGHYSDKKPIYVCRASIESVTVTGFVWERSEKIFACIVTHSEQLRLKQEFELLQNKANGAKVEWRPWEKLNPFSEGFDGAVSTGSRSEIYYVARHKINHTINNNGIDHTVGWFDQSSDLGKIYAVVENTEKSFESGEILVAIEAVRYELHDLKFKTTKLQESKNRTLLGQTILKNDGFEESDVNAAIAYKYDVIRNFGNHEGIARSVDTTAYLSKSETFDFFWGIQKSEELESSKSVGTRLKPGTAVNVTLWANHTTKEGPYDANLVIHYTDGTKSKKRRVTVNSGYEASLENPLEIEYSETYWIHNDTIVPTTTRRTTTTSSTTHRSVFKTSTVNELTAITDKSKPLANSNSIVEEDEDDENEIKDDNANSSLKAKINFASIILVLASLLVTVHKC